MKPLFYFSSPASPLHYWAHVDAAVSPFAGLAHDGDAQEVDRVHVEGDGDNVEGHGGVCDGGDGGGAGHGGLQTVATLLFPPVSRV